jgi:DNA-binding PadR family transcriptional regulator
MITAIPGRWTAPVSRRKVGNPLALVVLCLLLEKPMHPYEMAFTLRTRHKQESIKLNYGSLYTVVDALQREGLIEVRDVVREGRRPERTVYGLTRDGRTELYERMADLLGTPTKEYPQFGAALSLIGVLPPDKAVGLLSQRAEHLEREIEETRYGLESLLAGGLERLVLIEVEYGLALKEAELAFVRDFIRDVQSSELAWPEFMIGAHPPAGDELGDGDPVPEPDDAHEEDDQVS